MFKTAQHWVDCAVVGSNLRLEAVDPIARSSRFGQIRGYSSPLLFLATTPKARGSTERTLGGTLQLKHGVGVEADHDTWLDATALPCCVEDALS